MTALILDIGESDNLPEEAKSPGELSRAWIKTSRSEHTARARAGDLARLEADLPGALEKAMKTAGDANRVADEWIARQSRRGDSPMTINRRVSTLNGLLRYARRVGAITFAGDLRGVPSLARPNRRGPGESAVAGLQAALLARCGTPEGDRDIALWCLLYGLALRVGEAVALRVEDVDLAGGRIWVRRKRWRDLRQEVGLPPAAVDLLSPWAARASWPSGLWLGHFTAKGQELVPGLSEGGVRKILAKWKAEHGIDGPLRPHGLRHSHATAVIGTCGGDVAAASLGHADTASLRHYDDSKLARGAEGAAAALEIAGKPSKKEESP